MSKITPPNNLPLGEEYDGLPRAPRTVRSAVRALRQRDAGPGVPPRARSREPPLVPLRLPPRHRGVPQFLPATRFHHDARHQLPAALSVPALDGGIVLPDRYFHPRPDRFGPPAHRRNFERQVARGPQADHAAPRERSEEHTSELQSQFHLV